MSKRATSLRSQVEQVFHLTDALQVHLRILESARVPVEVRINPSPTGLAGGDIEALAFLVLMAAAKSAQEDLRAIMGEVKAINEAKKKMRTSLDKKRGARHPRPRQQGGLDLEAIFQLIATLYAKQLAAEVDELLGELDSVSELGEMESLRLQMAMDRLSKMASTLSNLLKKISDTSSQIVQNLK